jgi:hypothetical protein
MNKYGDGVTGGHPDKGRICALSMGPELHSSEPKRIKIIEADRASCATSPGSPCSSSIKYSHKIESKTCFEMSSSYGMPSLGDACIPAV